MTFHNIHVSCPIPPSTIMCLLICITSVIGMTISYFLYIICQYIIKTERDMGFNVMPQPPLSNLMFGAHESRGNSITAVHYILR